MINNELYMVLLPPISWCLFALGGTQISDTIKGQKWVRRFLLPGFYAGAVLTSHFYVKAAIVLALAIGFYILGYGDKVPWWRKALVGLGYSLISIPLGISWWNLITLLAFLALFKLSNTKWSSKIFVWKICEGFFGLFVGIQMAYSLMRLGLVW